MKNQVITTLLFCIILGIFVAYFIIQNYFLFSTKQINEQLNNIIIYANEKNWHKAEESLNRVEDFWNYQKYIVALNYAEADYSLFMDNLARIQGAIKAKDEAETICQAEANIKLWKNFTKIIPSP